MTSLRRTLFTTTTAAEAAAQTAALTAAWKKAFDGPIRAAAMQRALPMRRSAKATAPISERGRGDREPRF